MYGQTRMPDDDEVESVDMTIFEGIKEISESTTPPPRTRSREPTEEAVQLMDVFAVVDGFTPSNSTSTENTDVNSGSGLGSGSAKRHGHHPQGKEHPHHHHHVYGGAGHTHAKDKYAERQIDRLIKKLALTKDGKKSSNESENSIKIAKHDNSARLDNHHREDDRFYARDSYVDFSTSGSKKGASKTLKHLLTPSKKALKD